VLMQNAWSLMAFVNWRRAKTESALHSPSVVFLYIRLNYPPRV